MRIHLVSEHANPLAAVGGVDSGGQNVHVAALAVALAERGHEITVYTRRVSEDEPERVEMAPGVTVEHVRAGPAVPLPKDELLPYMPVFGEHLIRRWALERPDVAHAHFWMSGVATRIAAARHGVPVVQTFHALGVVKRRWQGGADTSPPQRIPVEAHLGRRADTVVATCTDEVNELLALGVPGSKLSVVPCGVDLDRFRPDGPVVPRGRRPRVLSIGRLVPRKGVTTLIQAIRHVPEAEVVIAGGSVADEEAVRLRTLAGRYGLDDRVRLIGSVAHEDVPALMRSADVLVTVPWYEPFGMVPVEAMACGVPVVASAVGGHLDTVAGCGVLVPPRRPRALARALRDLLDRPDLRANLGKAGVRRARARYGWATIAARIESVYTDVIAARRVRVAVAGG